jgi:hypothetical protein
MTIERPMFPPRAEQSNLIQFSDLAAARRAKKATPDALTSYRDEQIAEREAKLLEITTSPEKFTETCKNQRLRLSRRDVWWAAGSLTAYWRARLDWHTALSSAQTHGVADANKHPSTENENRFLMVDNWRASLMKQVLTPAPDAVAVAWKRAQLRAENYLYADVKPERIERAIADDVEFLRTHPTRRRPPQGGDAA